MARSTFGGTLTDWLLRPIQFGQQQLLALASDRTSLTFWSAKVDGTQYTDLLDANGTPTSSISFSGHQVPDFQGPDGVLVMWADKGDGSPRERMEARDLGAVAAAVASAAASASAAAASAAAAGTIGSDPNAVKFSSQSLTTPQKTQARTNIGAADAATVAAQGDSITSLGTSLAGKASTNHTHALADLSSVAAGSPANGQLLAYNSGTGKWTPTDPPPANLEHVIRWTGSAWETTRDAGWAFGVLFLSTNDPAATAPPSTNLKVGDRWKRHPDATPL